MLFTDPTYDCVLPSTVHGMAMRHEIMRVRRKRISKRNDRSDVVRILTKFHLTIANFSLILLKK